MMTSASLPEFELPVCGFLATISQEQRSFLACYGRFLRPRDGDVLIAEGALQESLYVILSGTLHVASVASGRQMLLATLNEGDTLGEVSLFDPGTASATAIMRGDGLVWALSREELDSFVEADPAAGAAALKGLLSQLASRLRSMNTKLATAEQRAAFHQFWNASNP